MTRLSSTGTFFQKVVFPALWLGMFGFAAIAINLGHSSPDPGAARFIFPVVWLVGVGIFCRLNFPLKHVWLGDTVFYVKGYLKQIEIPFPEVERVEINTFSRYEGITLVLKSPSPFGSRIRFMPSVRFWTNSPHPTFVLLSERFNLKPDAGRVDMKQRPISPEVARILANPADADEAALAAMTETILEELIDRLPRDSELRDAARRERQRRWYA